MPWSDRIRQASFDAGNAGSRWMFYPTEPGLRSIIFLKYDITSGGGCFDVDSSTATSLR